MLCLRALLTCPHQPRERFCEDVKKNVSGCSFAQGSPQSRLTEQLLAGVQLVAVHVRQRLRYGYALHQPHLSMAVAGSQEMNTAAKSRCLATCMKLLHARMRGTAGETTGMKYCSHTASSTMAQHEEPHSLTSVMVTATTSMSDSPAPGGSQRHTVSAAAPAECAPPPPPAEPEAMH